MRGDDARDLLGLAGLVLVCLYGLVLLAVAVWRLLA